MKATLSRLNTNTLTITITPNLIIAECCDNTLHIDTTLNFCDTFPLCELYLDDNRLSKDKRNFT